MDTSSLLHMRMHLCYLQNERGARNVGMGIIPEWKREKQKDYHEFKASLVYTVKSWFLRDRKRETRKVEEGRSEAQGHHPSLLSKFKTLWS